MIRLLFKVSTSKKTLILFCVYIVLTLVFVFALMPPFQAATGRLIPDMTPNMDYPAYRGLVDAMKAGPGLRAYRALEALDTIYPLVYALALAAIIGTAIKAMDKGHTAWRFLILAPLLPAATDYVENILVAVMIAVHPGEYPGLAAAASIITWLKFAFLIAAFMAALVAGGLAVARRSTPKALLTVRAPAPIGPYSQAVKTGRFVFLSGQLGMDPESGRLAEGAQAQTEQALDNIEAILETEGAPIRSIVKTTIFLVDMGDFAAVNEVYAKRFSGVMPARSTIQVAALPKGALVEIEAIARLR
jgi:2-iminobutanoate/2-iminopropanoate deaminase